MQSSLYVGLSGQIALKRRLDTIAANVANMNTVGFRAEAVRFEALVAQAGEREVAFSSTGETYLSRQAGPLVKTGDPLDVAVSGAGWLGIQTPDGPAYTRDGRMQMTQTGALQTLNGFPVLDAGGAPIVLDPNGGAPSIANDGMITQNGRQLGAIGLFAIDETAKLTRVENSAVVPDRPAVPILDFTRNGMAQGFVENANVNPVMEMTRLIMVQRAFDRIMAGTDAADSTMADAIKSLGPSG